jgi:hypothetical protein
LRFPFLAIASLLALSGCHLKTDPPGEAPANVTVQEGDGLVLLTWDMLPDLTYWIFFQPGSDVTAAAPGSIAIRRAVSPRAVGPLQNDTQYAFVMNATHDDSAAGPSSPVVLAKPRRAGKDWAFGAALGSPSPNLKAIAFNGSTFVAVGDGATVFAGAYNYASTSPPGVSAWQPATSLPPTLTENLTAVTTSGGFLALGTNGFLMNSPDGLTWAPTAPIPSTGMNGVAIGVVSGFTVFVAVGNGGSIFISGDLLKWIPAKSNTANDLFGVSFINGIFVATGAAGTLLTSPDASTWTPQTSNAPSTSALRSVAFGPTASGFRYVAVGDAGTIVTSGDVVKWDPVTPPPLAQNLNSVVFGSRFVAVGQGGKIAYSDDGLSWSLASAAGSDDLASVIFAPAMYVTVGAAGANAVSK